MVIVHMSDLLSPSDFFFLKTFCWFIQRLRTHVNDSLKVSFCRPWTEKE